MAEQLANNAAGILSANMLIGATSCTLNAGQGAAFPSSGNFRILIGSELMLVGARSTDTLSSITRGIEGTSAAAHNSADAVTHILTQAGLLQYIQDNSVQKPASVVSGEWPVYNGTTWARSSVTTGSVSGLSPGANGQFLQTTGGVTVWGANPIIAATHLVPMTNPVNTSLAFTANQAYLVPIPAVYAAVSISRLFYQVTTQSGNMDMGIYYSDDELTFTRLLSTGSFAVPAGGTGMQTKTVSSTALTPAAGRRWFIGWAVDNGTATFTGDNTQATRTSMPTYIKATSFPLPSSLTSMTGPGNVTNLPYFTLAV